MLAFLLLAGVMLWPVQRFLAVALARFAYPFELEWMEGAIVDHVRVVLSGQSLYREPTLDFAPFIYVPGYYYVSAVVSKIVGVGLLAPRLVSLISISGCFALLGVWVAKESKCILAGFVAIGLFAATFGQSAFWFDVARVDSLFLLFLLAGSMLARFGRGRGHGIACGILLACAALTKQVGLVLAVPPILFACLESRTRGLRIFTWYAAIVALACGLLELTSHGWFSFYAFRVPAEHELLWADWKSVLVEQFWTPVAPMVLCAAAVIAGLSIRQRFPIWAFYATWTLAALTTAYSTILHTGGYPNVLMPAHAALALAAGLVFSSIWQRDGSVAVRPAQLLGRRLFAVCLVGLQLILLPEIKDKDLEPTARDVELGRQMLEAVRACRGPVWMVSSGYYPMLTHGSGVTAHAMALVDIYKSRQSSVKRKLTESIVQRIRSKHFGTIVGDRVWGFLPGEIVQAIQENYHLERHIIRSEEGRFWPKSGAAVRPDQIWKPNVARE